MENEVKELFLEGRNCINIWKKKLWLIIAMAILGLVAGNILTLRTGEDEYMATAKITSYTVNSDTLIAYGSLIPSLGYCEQAAEMLNDGYITAERIRENVTITTTKGVPVVAINVHDIDKDVAVKVANALAKVAVNNMNQQRGADSAQLLEEASTTVVYSDAGTKNIILRVGCMFLAALATIAVLGVKAITSRKIVVEEDFTCGGQLSLIGMVPLYEGEDA